METIGDGNVRAFFFKGGIGGHIAYQNLHTTQRGGDLPEKHSERSSSGKVLSFRIYLNYILKKV